MTRDYEAMQKAVARLLSDRATRVRFFAPGSTVDLGLSAEDAARLRTLDARKFGIMTEGFDGKRLERLRGAFPLAWHHMIACDADGGAAFLATDPPPDPAREDAAFVRFAPSRGRTPEEARMLSDLVRTEAAGARWPPRSALPFRLTPASVPCTHAQSVVLELEGPLDRLLAGARPRYLASPRSVLVVQGPPATRIEMLPEETLALWRACDGTSTLAALCERFGEGARATILRWATAGLVEVATPS